MRNDEYEKSSKIANANAMIIVRGVISAIYSKNASRPRSAVTSKFLHKPIIAKINEFFNICLNFKSNVTIMTGT